MMQVNILVNSCSKDEELEQTVLFSNKSTKVKSFIDKICVYSPTVSLSESAKAPLK